MAGAPNALSMVMDDKAKIKNNQIWGNVIMEHGSFKCIFIFLSYKNLNNNCRETRIMGEKVSTLGNRQLTIGNRVSSGQIKQYTLCEQ